jgi:hypothetical protein
LIFLLRWELLFKNVTYAELLPLGALGSALGPLGLLDERSADNALLADTNACLAGLSSFLRHVAVPSVGVESPQRKRALKKNQRLIPLERPSLGSSLLGQFNRTQTNRQISRTGSCGGPSSAAQIFAASAPIAYPKSQPRTPPNNKNEPPTRISVRTAISDMHPL